MTDRPTVWAKAPKVAFEPETARVKGWMWMTPSLWVWMPFGSRSVWMSGANLSQT